MKSDSKILWIIVLAQFCCTSLWFAGNGVVGDLVSNFHLKSTALGHLTSAVQFGFISGTLVFAILTIADQFSPSKVFLYCALLGALCNTAIVWEGNNLSSLLIIRFSTGFFLAGIYPVGMKIAADYFQAGLGKSLGYLVGALVVGTAFPHFIKGTFETLPWKYILVTTSSLAVLGGLIMNVLVPDGPYRKSGSGLNLSAFFHVFKNRDFRSAAFGYFGHMWELYAFWTFVPVMISTYNEINPVTVIAVSTTSFIIIGIGGLGCVLAGYLSNVLGTKRTAFSALLLSGICCMISPFIFNVNSDILFVSFLLFWGITVVADSPLFSTMVAHNASPNIKGTALTIVNCIGFSITIVSIQMLNSIREISESNAIYALLGIGPLFGLYALINAPNKLPVE